MRAVSNQQPQSTLTDVCIDLVEGMWVRPQHDLQRHPGAPATALGFLSDPSSEAYFLVPFSTSGAKWARDDH